MAYPPLNTARTVQQELDVYNRQVAQAKRDCKDFADRMNMQQWGDHRHTHCVKRCAFLARRH